jgi:predicted CXXCH cytochrome family protein
MKRVLAVAFLTAAPLFAVSSTMAVIGSQHDLTASGSAPVKSAAIDSCIFCHAPHNIVPNIPPLWNHSLSTVTYTPYTSTTYTSGAQTPSAGSSKLCLSCHDGTVAVGLTVAQGLIATTGTMNSSDVFGSDLSHSHPMSMSMVDDGSLVSTLFASPPATKDPAVLLVSGKIECTTCHDPHVPNRDAANPMFLVRSNSGSAICLACHDPTQFPCRVDVRVSCYGDKHGSEDRRLRSLWNGGCERLLELPLRPRRRGWPTNPGRGGIGGLYAVPQRR